MIYQEPQPKSYPAIRSCVTVSLVPEARGGPFVFWGDLPAACEAAHETGFHAIEVFPPEPEAIEEEPLRRLLAKNRLELAAVGTGAGWVRHRLHLCLPDPAQRAAARDFIRRTIDAAGRLGASAIIGSMQGRWSDAFDRSESTKYLFESLSELGNHARQYGVPLFYEPLNRYETNICNSVPLAAKLLKTLKIENVLVLADFFHMNIEEKSIADAIREAGDMIGHVHFVDSNRHAVGSGHIDIAPVADALRQIGYSGYVSAEVLPEPDSKMAALMTKLAYHKYFPNASESKSA